MPVVLLSTAMLDAYTIDARAPLPLFALPITFGLQEFPLLAHVYHQQHACQSVWCLFMCISLSFIQPSPFDSILTVLHRSCVTYTRTRRVTLYVLSSAEVITQFRTTTCYSTAARSAGARSAGAQSAGGIRKSVVVCAPKGGLRPSAASRRSTSTSRSSANRACCSSVQADEPCGGTPNKERSAAIPFRWAPPYHGYTQKF